MIQKMNTLWAWGSFLAQRVFFCILKLHHNITFSLDAYRRAGERVRLRLDPLPQREGGIITRRWENGI
jgi:hypothetical protein